MKRNKILSAICAISMVATLISSVSVFADYVTEADVKAAVEETSVRYVADESNVYTSGSTVKFKVYVDNMPTLDGITNTGSSKSPKYNGAALSQWMVSCSPTVGDGWELMDIPGSGLTTDSSTYGEAADKFSISFVGMKTDEYVSSSYFEKDDAYWAELEFVLSADVSEEEITIPVVVEAVFQCGQNTNQLKQVNFKDASGLKIAPKAEEPPYVAYKIDEVQDPAKDAELPTVPYTQGFKATVIPNSDSITGVTCTLSTAGKPDYVVNEWATLAIGKVETTFAINVLNVPAGVAVTAEWNASK